jgi:hypothetical protein
MLVRLFMVLTIGSAGVQAQSAKQFRTPWGEPDLQGIWNGETLTPLQRPARFANKPVLTPEEAAKAEAEVDSRPGRDKRAKEGTEKDVAGAYNQAFFDRSPRSLHLVDRRTSLIIDPSNGLLPLLTPEAQKRRAAIREYEQALLQGTSGGRPGPPSPLYFEPPPFYNVNRLNRADGPEDRSLQERCLAWELPHLDTFYRIVQSPGQVGIVVDAFQGQGFVRTIPVDGSKHLPASIRSYKGDGRGHWEGETLVVDISNFSPKSDYLGSRQNRHVVERFKRVSQNRLEYTVTVEDPTTWTRPWTAMEPLEKESDKENQIYEADCHEGNYGIIGMLANTRAAEKLFKEEKGPNPRTMDIATGGGVEPADQKYSFGRAGNE